MKHLFLTSIDITGFLKYIDKPAHELHAVYIPTAANTYEDKWFIEKDREELHKAGVRFHEIDLHDYDSPEEQETLRNSLSNIDVVIVGGGNTFYLLQEVILSAFDDKVKRLIEKGVWYVGSSAGAVLTCPNIEPVKYFDEPKDAPYLNTNEGMGLVDFLILPHYNPSDKNFDKAIADCKKLGLAYQCITNDESILVEGDTWRIVEKE